MKPRHIFLSLLLLLSAPPMAGEDSGLSLQLFLNRPVSDSNATDFAATEDRNTLQINSDNLHKGVNLLAIRAVDSNGNVSPAYWRTIYVSDDAAAAAAEYAVDNDPGAGNATRVNDISAKNFSFAVPTDNLSVGSHTLYVRLLSNGKWSNTFSQPFLVTGDGLTLEWFIGLDPGVGNGHMEEATQGKNLIALPTEGFDPGAHLLSFRIHDNDGKVSPTYTRAIYVSEQIQMSVGEYYIDSDPGAGNGTRVPFWTEHRFVTSIPTDNLTDGSHQLNVRVYDNTIGRWIDTWSGPFTVVAFGAIQTVRFDMNFSIARSGDILVLSSTDLPDGCHVTVTRIDGLRICDAMWTDSGTPITLAVPASTRNLIIGLTSPTGKRALRKIN